MIFRCLAASSVAGLTAFILVLFFSREIWINEKIEGARGGTRSSRLPDASALESDDRPLILLLGDSRLSRWSPVGNHEPWHFVNRAVGGETASQLAQRFQREILYFRPAQIVVSSGINDIIGMSFMPAAESDAALASLIKTFADLANQANRAGSKIVITTIVPPSRPGLLRRFAWSHNTIKLVQQANRSMHTSSWPPNTTILDFDGAFHLDREGYLSSDYREDTLHMNKKGYLLFEQALLNVLNENWRKK